MAYRLEPIGKTAKMWDQLRKDARKLEGELEMKLAHMSRLCSGLDPASSGPNESARAQNGASATSTDVTSLLKRLAEVHRAMDSEVLGSDVRQHTIARHKDIMQDYSQEYKRLSAQIDLAKDKADLMAGSKDTAPLMGVTVQSNANALMRERNSIAAGTNALDEVLAHASQMGGSLRDQRTLFDSIGNKMMSVGTKFPVVNGLLNAVRRKKSRETIVITGLVAICTLLLLAYLMRKRS